MKISSPNPRSQSVFCNKCSGLLPNTKQSPFAYAKLCTCRLTEIAENIYNQKGLEQHDKKTTVCMIEDAIAANQNLSQKNLI